MRKGMKEGCFAGLSRGMYHKVLLIPNQTQNIVVQIPERIHHIVIFRLAKSCRIEEASHTTKIEALKEILQKLPD
jgi:hypothetical protein